MIKKAFILCGGKATRFNRGKPGPLKALIKIKNIEIILRIIKIYSDAGVKEIYLLGGYKFSTLEKYFKKKNNSKVIIRVLNTGLNTNTGGRVKKIRKLIKGKEKFFLTYGDSLTDFSPLKAIKIIKNKPKAFLISIYKKQISYGTLELNKKKVLKKFDEKKYFYINAGFYIFDYRIFNYIKKFSDSLEKQVIPNILKKNKIKFDTYICKFWHPMDNPQDKKSLNSINL